jgi:hypothetical protein
MNDSEFVEFLGLVGTNSPSTCTQHSHAILLLFTWFERHDGDIASLPIICWACKKDIRPCAKLT